MARRCRSATSPGDNATRPTRAVHGSAQLEHRTHRARLSRSVECGGVVPKSQEGWRSPVGTIAPVGRWIDPAAHVCDGPGIDAGEPGKDRARTGRIGQSDAGKSGRHQGHAGSNFHWRSRAPTNGHARTGTHCGPASSGKGLRAGQVVSRYSFMHDFATLAVMIHEREAKDSLNALRK